MHSYAGKEVCGMARLKRKSVALEKARKRLAGIKSIDSTLDMGNGLSVAEYEAIIGTCQDKVDKYNKQLSVADERQNIAEASEKELNEFSERMLEAVGSVYGHDSNEYEQAGGRRKSERKRPKRKAGNGDNPEVPQSDE